MTPPPSLSDTAMAFCLFLIFLVPLAAAGLALINTGLGRSRSAAHTMFASLSVMAVAAGVYFAWGFALQGYFGRPGYMIVAGGKGWDWVAQERPFFLGLGLTSSPAFLAALLGTFSVGIAALIPLGSGMERWKLGPMCISTALMAGWTFPLFAHWVWGGGWLAQLGVNFGLGYGFLDAGGGATIQAVGGLTALCVAWILGPRRGKYSLEGTPTAMPGHQGVLALLGCVLAWVGWMGLNSAGAILYAGAEPGRIAFAALNTSLAAFSGLLIAAAVTRFRFGKPDASLSCNGWVSGLVASSASAPFVAPAAAVLIGLVAGALVPVSVDWLELHLGVDDPGGSVSVHAVGGLWGVFAAGLFARPALLAASGWVPASAQTGLGQWMAQLVGIATLLGFVLPVAYGLNWLLNRFYPFRVPPEGERQGVDLHELGAGAYPEFLTHTEDFTRR